MEKAEAERRAFDEVGLPFHREKCEELAKVHGWAHYENVNDERNMMICLNHERCYYYSYFFLDPVMRLTISFHFYDENEKENEALKSFYRSNAPLFLQNNYQQDLQVKNM